MQALVEEKTRALAKSDARLEDVRRSAKREALADRAEVERLTERLYQEHGMAIRQLRSAVSAIEQVPNNSKSIQSDSSTGNLGNVQNTIPSRDPCEVHEQFKKKIDAANNARERAESRFSDALCEIQAQRRDLIALASQLQGTDDERKQKSVDNKFSSSEVQKLQRLVSEKEAKLQSLRESIIKLKAEFVTAEEVNAVSALELIQKTHQEA